ncbi:hypothetical protein RWX45_10820, partial [Actinomyces sp. MRS3W]|nr:hypothetical protein [Actinomyces sp. MRS3W]
ALARALRELAEGTVDPAPLARNARALIERDFDSRVQAAVLSSWQSAPELQQAPAAPLDTVSPTPALEEVH